jgi:hypothetical protein
VRSEKRARLSYLRASSLISRWTGWRDTSASG